MQDKVVPTDIIKLVEELLVKNYKFQPIGPTDNPSFNSVRVKTLVVGKRTITSSSEKGVPGEVYWDQDYLYVCVGKDSWKRVALSSW